MSAPGRQPYAMAHPLHAPTTMAATRAGATTRATSWPPTTSHVLVSWLCYTERIGFMCNHLRGSASFHRSA